MPVSYSHQFIFFHIPRCAGTSLDYYYNFHDGNPLFGLRLVGDRVLTLQHLTYAEIKNQNILTDDTLNAFFKFTIIRDPFKRMVSDYLWQQSHDIHDQFSGLSFQQFLDIAERTIAERSYFKKAHYDHFRPMTEYCYWRDKLIVDKIIVLERIDQDIAPIMERINLNKLLKLNSSTTNTEHLTTKENIDRVYLLYAADKELHDRLMHEAESAD